MGEELMIQGFRAAAIEAGIRKQGRLDLGLIVCDSPAAAAGVFTDNRVQAAPVLLDRQRIKSGQAQAILINSGIANACTGETGMRLATATSQLVADSLQIPTELVQVASTGVIGEQLEFARFAEAMPGLVARLAPDGFDQVARAMMTTDTVPKTACRSVSLDGREVKLLGLAKGAGMIMPNMATMLSFVMTDAAITAPLLQESLNQAVKTTFNAITIDGDTSTNDTLLVLANGLAGNPLIDGSDQEAAVIFRQALEDLLRELALKIVADGEGATKLITIRVSGAASEEEAIMAARTVANSNLVKTAFFGEDANWGRIIAALGRSGARFHQEQVDIGFDDVWMVKSGVGQGRSVEAKATEVLRKQQFTVQIDLHAGPATAEYYTCDFSVDYVKINADYRS